MLIHLLAAALAVQGAPTATAPINQEQRALLRCAAAFAVVAGNQAKGEASAQRWPELGTRGREFFVRAMAQLMDQTGLDRAGISAAVSTEARAMAASGEVDQVMPACLTMLEASGV